MGRKHSEKKSREIACIEQFLLFPQCFQKTSTADMLKLGMTTVTDFRNWLLGKSSDRVTGYSDKRQV